MTPSVSSASLSHASHEIVTRHDPILLSPRAEGGGRVGWEGRGRDGARVGGKGEGEQVSTEAATGPPSAGVSPGCTRRVTPASAGGDVREGIVGSTCPLAGWPDTSPLSPFPHPVLGVDRPPSACVGSPGLTVGPSPALSSPKGQSGWASPCVDQDPPSRRLPSPGLTPTNYNGCCRSTQARFLMGSRVSAQQIIQNKRKVHGRA